MTVASSGCGGVEVAEPEQAMVLRRLVGHLAMHVTVLLAEVDVHVAVLLVLLAFPPRRWSPISMSCIPGCTTCCSTLSPPFAMLLTELVRLRPSTQVHIVSRPILFFCGTFPMLVVHRQPLYPC